MSKENQQLDDIVVFCHPIHAQAAYEILREYNQRMACDGEVVLGENGFIDVDRCECGHTRDYHEKHWPACKGFREAHK